MMSNFSIINSRFSDARRDFKSTGIGKITNASSDELILKIADKTISLKSHDQSLQAGDLVRYRVVSEKIFIEKIKSDSSNDSNHDTFSSPDNTFLKLSKLIDSAIQTVNETDSLSEELKTTLNSINSLLKQQPLASSILQKINEIQVNKTEDYKEIKEKLLQVLAGLKNQIINNALSVPDSKQLIEIENPEIKNGYFRFDNLNEARQFLNTITGLSTAQPQPDMGQNETVVLKLIPGNGISFGLLISDDELNKEITSLLLNFKSRTMQSIPADVLKGLLQQRGSLDIDALNSLDGELGQGQLYLDNKRAGSETAQKAVVTQWLNIALDNKPILPEIVRLLPASTTSIPIFLHQISSGIKNDSLSQLPDSQIGLTESDITSNSDRENFIPNLLNKLGINFENSMLNGELTKNSTLKEILLKQLNLQLNSQVEFFCKEFRNMLHSFENVKFSEHQKKPAIFEHLKTLTEKLYNAIPELQESFSPQIFKFLENIKLALTTLQTSLDYAIDSSKSFIEPATSLPSGISIKPEFITESGNYLKEFKSSVLEAILLSTQKNDSTEPLLATLFESIRSDLEDKFPGSEEQFLKQAKTSDPQTKQTAEGIINDQPSNTGVSNKTQNLESLLNRVESQQLLAKNTQTSNGEQQILSLPMHINGEWAELHIRMEKRRIAKSGNSEKSISVFLDVSPSGLGNVSARIDYTKNKSFKLHVEFEEKKTREWFEANSSQLQSALKGLGLPSVLVGFHVQKKMQSEENLNTASFSGLLDLKV